MLSKWSWRAMRMSWRMKGSRSLLAVLGIAAQTSMVSRGRRIQEMGRRLLCVWRLPPRKRSMGGWWMVTVCYLGRFCMV